MAYEDGRLALGRGCKIYTGSVRSPEASGGWLGEVGKRAEVRGVRGGREGEADGDWTGWFGGLGGVGAMGG